MGAGQPAGCIVELVPGASGERGDFGRGPEVYISLAQQPGASMPPRELAGFVEVQLAPTLFALA